MQPSTHTKYPWSQHCFRGLTPDIFWSSRSALLATPRSDLESFIDGLVYSRTLREAGLAEPDWTVALKPIHSVRGRLLSGVVSELPNSPPPLLSTTSKGLAHRLAYVLIAPRSPNELPVEEGGDLACQNVLRMSLPTSVSAHSNYFLYNTLPKAIPFIRKHLTAGEDVCVACPTGKDLGPGVIVAVLSLFFGDDGELLSDDDMDSKGEPAGKGLRGISIECVSRASNRQIYNTKTAPMDHFKQPESQSLQEHPQTGQRIPHVASPPPALRVSTAYLSHQFLTLTQIYSSSRLDFESCVGAEDFHTK
jgi:hypothetical protein